MRAAARVVGCRGITIIRDKKLRLLQLLQNLLAHHDSAVVALVHRIAQVIFANIAASRPPLALKEHVYLLVFSSLHMFAHKYHHRMGGQRTLVQLWTGQSR
jgi:hypothetical protein